MVTKFSKKIVKNIFFAFFVIGGAISFVVLVGRSTKKEMMKSGERSGVLLQMITMEALATCRLRHRAERACFWYEDEGKLF